jgi:hypothetical protein
MHLNEPVNLKQALLSLAISSINNLTLYVTMAVLQYFLINYERLTMHKLITLPVLLLALFLPFTSMAAEAEEITLDASYFAGSWKLIATGPKLFAKKPDRVDDNPFSYVEKKKIKENQTWTFNTDGSFSLSAIDHRAAAPFTVTSTFTVENNTLIIKRVGRSLYDRYKVFLREGKKLVLKGGMMGYAVFEKL